MVIGFIFILSFIFLGIGNFIVEFIIVIIIIIVINNLKNKFSTPIDEK